MHYLLESILLTLLYVVTLIGLTISLYMAKLCFILVYILYPKEMLKGFDDENLKVKIILFS